MLNARNEHDRSKFVEDLKESIAEMDELEQLRLEGEVEKQSRVSGGNSENRDSGITDAAAAVTSVPHHAVAEPSQSAAEKPTVSAVSSLPLGASREEILNAFLPVMKFLAVLL